MKTSLLILFITSLILSRTMFFFINDPEGTNLLIVAVMALGVFFLSLSINLLNLKTTSRKKLLLTIIFQIVIVSGFLVLNSFTDKKEKQTFTLKSYKDIEYMIEGKKITLSGEFSYFGNELVTDLNGDARNDVVFLIRQNSGGSGTFYYVVSALQTNNRYLGSDGFLLGDRIAPQTTELSKNPKHKTVIVVNFADRGVGEPMTTKPSLGKSVYLKLDIEHMQWGIVVPNFEGESR